MVARSEGGVQVNAARDVLEGMFDSAAEVVPTRLADAVIQHITEAILEGRLKPGDRLPSEARLAASFGVSKQISREAIRQLAAMGVVHIQQGKATRVRVPDAAPLDRFYRFAVGGTEAGLLQANELRRIVEPSTARLAALRRSADGVGALRRILDRMEAALEDADAFTEADLDFHETIAALTGNRLLELQMQGLRPVIREVSQMFTARRKRDRRQWRATFERHAAIVRAIEAGDAEAASEAMLAHFRAADQAIRELFPLSREMRS